MNVSTILKAIAFMVTPIATASATVPFSRSQLSGVLVNALIDIAHHGVQDAPYVQTKLAIEPNSQWVNYFVGDILHSVSVSAFDKAAAVDSSTRGIEAEGDVLPMRSGKFWNLRFQYVLEPLKGLSPYPARIEIIDVEEYACITLGELRYSFPGQTPTETQYNSPIQGQSYFDIDGPSGLKTKLVFQRKSGDEGCINYIALWQLKNS